MEKGRTRGMPGASTNRPGRGVPLSVATALMISLLALLVQGVPAARAAGSTWHVAPSPNPGTASDSFRSVSCLNATDCWAAGSAGGVGLVEHFNGTSWTPLASIPAPSGSTGFAFTGISCVSDTACTAVGYWTESSSAFALAESYNGSSWVIETLPNLGSSQAEFASVSCTSGATCMAVGDYYNSGFGAYATLAMQLDGTSGTQDDTSSLDLGVNYSIPTSVTCVTSADCTATGSYGSPGTPQLSLIGHWNGSSWAHIASVNPGSSNNDLVGVTCVPGTGTDCTAVGSYFSFGPGGGLLVEHWDGSTWSQVTGIPASAGGLFSVSCPASGSCTAAGSNGPGASTTLILELSGGTWTQATSPNPALYSNVLNSVSCTSVCMAVGSQAWQNVGPQLTLTETTGSGPFPPGVNGVTPAQGTTSGGTTVTITGSGFTGATAVRFGTVAAKSFTVVSNYEITAITRPEGTRVVDVSVTTTAGSSAVGYPDDQFAFIPRPTVHSLSPSTGTTAGGTAVTVKGSHFTGTTAVQLGPASISGFTVVSDTEIIFLTPPHVAAQEDVTVTTPEGTSRTTNSDVFTYSTSAVTVTTTTLPAGNQGLRYPPFSLQASGGTTPYRWALAPGSSLPSAMRLSSIGKLSGVPQCAGNYNFTVVVTDRSHGNASAPLTLVVDGPGCG
jgi:hypothetical protein